MKKLLLIIIVLCVFLLASCRISEEYDFLNSADKISEIAIVRLNFDDDGVLMQTEIFFLTALLHRITVL